MSNTDSAGLDDGDISLFIPLSSIYEEFSCPICFHLIQNASLTPCGHLFCQGCLAESLNRDHVCPCCRHPCDKSHIYPSRHTDKIIEILRKEREKAAKKYFEELVLRASVEEKREEPAHRKAHEGEDASRKNDEGERSPIEIVFQKYMRKTLSSFLTYFSQLKEKKDKQKAELQDRLAVEITSIQMESEQHIRKIRSDPALSADDILSRVVAQKHSASTRVSELTERVNADIAALEATFDESTRLLVSAYEKYLSEMEEASQFLPTTFTVSIPSRKLTLRAISIRPTDTLSDLKAKVEERLKALGDPLCDLGVNTKFFLLPLFGGIDTKEEEGRQRKKGEKMEVGSGSDGSGKILLRDGLAILLSCNPPPPQGSTIEIVGSLSFESDKPKECFSQLAFTKGESECNYFTCDDCHLNWICQSCVGICHKSHKVKEYLSHHKPNWACCYCQKYKKCVIMKKK